MTLGNDLASRVRSIGRGFAVTAAIGTAAGAAATGYGLWEKNQFVVREETLPILPAGFGPFRILHLSDIHFVPGQHRKAQWLSSLAQLQPDLVVNTGDNLSHAKGVDPLVAALRPLLEFPGVFVPGSNDYFGPSLKNPASRSRRLPKTLGASKLGAQSQSIAPSAATSAPVWQSDRNA